MIIIAHTKKYINLKIENCEKLIEAASSEDQKEIYLGYLDFWTKTLPAKERPKAIAKKAEAEQKKLEIAAAKKDELERIKKEKEEADLKEAAEIKAAKIAAKKAELAELEAEEAEFIEIIAVPKTVEIVIDENTGETEAFEESALAKIFELENPGKKAYRTQNGDRIKTIAFKEYLIKRTQ